jgi:two-component system, OmpR family, phosphate regulon sensor histidine kinase PhoR
MAFLNLYIWAVNKKIISGLIVLMGISILGIITVQLIWMNNALRVKNELFSRSVNEALNNTVNKLDDIHNFGVVNQMVFSDSLHWENDIDEDFDMEFFQLPDSVDKLSSIKKPSHPLRIIREFGPKGEDARIEIVMNSEIQNEEDAYSFKFDVKTDIDNRHIIVDNEETHGKGIFIIRKDTIISDVDSLYEISAVKIDSLLTSLNTFDIIQPDISKRAKTKATRLKRMANKVVMEISGWDVHEVDKKLLQNVLGEELQNKDIPIDFEFGILRDSVLVESHLEVTDSIKLVNSEYQVNLYPHDIFQKNLKLTLFFPERESFIYRSLNWLLVASFLFSIFILVTFGLSIFYILRQKKISEMKSDFINNMTHEFKTPIATISVATDSIINEKVVDNPERIRYFAGMIKKENARMNRQVEDILTIARLDKKDFEFHWEAVDVHDLINDAIQGIILQVEKREGSIDAKLNANNSMITTDRIHCTNVVYNLLDNAIKYSEDSPEIIVSTKNRANGVLVSVEDKGIGMTKLVQNKIFERFYRQTSGNIHNVKGFGLGLSYVKAVLEANRGTISVQSELEKGSKFEVFLPFVKE